MIEPYKLPIDYPEAWRIIKERILKLQEECKRIEREADTEIATAYYKGEQQGLHIAYEKIMDQIPY